MDYKEALEWLRGKRSMTNIIPQHPLETWQVRICQADAARLQEAYWIVRAHREGLVKEAHDATRTENSDKRQVG